VILVTGSATATPATRDEVLRLSLEHVQRSRTEPGCLSHAVHVDAEDPLRLVFVERWTDTAALHAHFAVPEAQAFVTALTPLLAVAPTLEVYEATRV
jgi:quinol monooxygenase YgiN